MKGVEAVYHLATRIPKPERMTDPDAWTDNDKLRSHATRILVDAALAAGVDVFVLPSVTFLYPAEGPVDEQTPTNNDGGRLRSMLDAEAETQRVSRAERRGVILRLGLLWGPGTGNDVPEPRRGATLHIEDAGEALRLALSAPKGIYNVVADGERVGNARFKATTGWRPRF
jgi:nucleoside-diphosphate-sugar epimerase